MSVYEKLPGALLPWYYLNKRDLPWRQDRQPYHVWLSEIMLQQTRVEAVKGYYVRFLAALPTIGALAACDDDGLHKLWEGLGYYSRVRNLKKAARKVMDCHGGVFPRDYAQVLALPGIGEYTAGAICSICFDAPTPAVDGNVLRLISRLTDDDTPIDTPLFKKQVRQALAEIYPKEAGDFTQALMELGATVCGPNRKPDCEACPCRTFCMGRRSGRAEDLPVKASKKERRMEEKTVFILSSQGRFALCKRGDEGLLGGMWQFPDVPGKLDISEIMAEVERMGLKPTNIYKKVERKHIFTHVQWEMRGVYLEVAEPAGDFAWLTARELRAQAALPTAYRLFFEKTGSDQ